jgi:hypothetical protein
LQCPSSSEYSLWAWRWTAAGELTGPPIMSTAGDGTAGLRR